MSVSPLSSPAVSTRNLARPSKRSRATEQQQQSGAPRTLPLPRLLETLDETQLRTVLLRICERHEDIRNEVMHGAPRPTAPAALRILEGYQTKVQDALPYGHSNSSSDYTYFRVKQPLIALVEAILDFIPQYLPPVEEQATVSLQYLDGATRLAHTLPDWQSQAYRHHKETAFDELAKAWALVISEAAKRGGGFLLHNGGWDQVLAKHNQQSGGRLQVAMQAMTNNVGWSNQDASSSSSSDPNSILNQLMNGTYGAPVRVGPF
jgi:protein Cut8